MLKGREKEIHEFWKKKKIYGRAKKAVKGGKKYYFLDGPPYATGFIHLGTAWNKVLKDCFIRYIRMRGFDVWDQPGYDTHGLPIEKKVEQELGLKFKSDIEKFGVDKFNRKCREFATKFIGVMNDEFSEMGVWMDWDNPYLTLENSYIESAWAVFKIAFEKGFLYKDLYPVHVCTQCETVVAYNEIEYIEMKDPSIYVKFRISDNESLLIWTTTPWTLLANTGVMANPKIMYAKVEVGNETLIMAENLVESVMNKAGAEYKITGRIIGSELIGTKYENPLEDMIPDSAEIKKNGWCVIGSEQYVSVDDGTGIVHTAPGHGAEDFDAGKSAGLPVKCFIGIDGKFERGPLKGKAALDTNEEIIEELDRRGVLFYKNHVTHDYPKCWRCESKLIILAIPQWFFRITKMRDKMLKENENVKWHPQWAGARFKNWLESLGDWPISRQRYWGIPLPIWLCKNEHIRVIGSMKELPKRLKDLHRPHADKIELMCSRCKEPMKRVPDVLDVWFDAGLASWASLGWPRNKKTFTKLWPADLNIEGPDQIRGWWNSQLITSMITFGKAPFKRILFHGFSLDAAGAKMSKSRGNVVTPESVIEKNYSIDSLRFYLLSSPPWDDFYFDWKSLDELSKNMLIIKNSFNFVKTYVPKGSGKRVNAPKTTKLMPEDRWILSRLNSVISKATEAMDDYEPHRAEEMIKDFAIEEFSRVYIKLIRDRVWPLRGNSKGRSYASSAKSQNAAYCTLRAVCENICTMLAPFTPFFAEELYQDYVKKFQKEDSVHLRKWPAAGKSDAKLEGDMKKALGISEIANGIRSEAKIKLRWPLMEIVVNNEMKDAVKTFRHVIENLSNAKYVSCGEKQWQKTDGDIKVWLDTKMDANLKKEAGVREIIRRIQDARKKDGMIISDKIEVSVNGFDISGFEDEIKSSVGAKTIGKIKEGKNIEMDFEGVKIIITYKKI